MNFTTSEIISAGSLLVSAAALLHGIVSDVLSRRRDDEIRRLASDADRPRAVAEIVHRSESFGYTTPVLVVTNTGRVPVTVNALGFIDRPAVTVPGFEPFSLGPAECRKFLLSECDFGLKPFVRLAQS